MDNEQNTFTFMHERFDGKRTNVTFEADTWVEAMNEFFTFLKGLGYLLEKGDIQIHERHQHLDWHGVYAQDNPQQAPAGHWNIQFGDK